MNIKEIAGNISEKKAKASDWISDLKKIGVPAFRVTPMNSGDVGLTILEKDYDKKRVEKFLATKGWSLIGGVAKGPASGKDKSPAVDFVVRKDGAKVKNK